MIDRNCYMIMFIYQGVYPIFQWFLSPVGCGVDSQDSSSSRWPRLATMRGVSGLENPTNHEFGEKTPRKTGETLGKIMGETLGKPVDFFKFEKFSMKIWENPEKLQKDRHFTWSCPEISGKMWYGKARKTQISFGSLNMVCFFGVWFSLVSKRCKWAWSGLI